MTPAARIISASSTRDFQDAVILGMGLPTQIDGQPVKYRWKESLPIGTALDADNKEFKVDSARIKNLVLNFKKAKEQVGFLPYIPPDHKTARGDKNFGFIVDARVNDRGSLELLHQLIGEDAALASARNKTSICTVTDVKDERGNFYDELIDHNALLPNPRLNNLESFTPAIAASRGSVPVSSFTLAAQNEKDEPMLDLKKLRAALKAADDVADEKVIELALSRCANETTATERAIAAEASLATVKTERDEARTKLAAAETKALELSRNAPKTPDEDTLLLMADSFNTEREAALASGGISPDTAKEIDKLLMADGKPNSLALSRLPGSPQPMAKRFWQIMRSNKPTPIGEKTGMQFSRQTPVDDPNQKSEEELAKAGRAQGKAYAEAGAK